MHRNSNAQDSTLRDISLICFLKVSCYHFSMVLNSIITKRKWALIRKEGYHRIWKQSVGEKFYCLGVETDHRTCDIDGVRVGSERSQTVQDDWTGKTLRKLVSFRSASRDLIYTLWAKNVSVSENHSQILEVYDEQATSWQYRQNDSKERNNDTFFNQAKRMSKTKKKKFRVAPSAGKIKVTIF